jgi:hypothetical protein
MTNESAYYYWANHADTRDIVEAYFDGEVDGEKLPDDKHRDLIFKMFHHGCQIPELYVKQIMAFLDEKGRGYFFTKTVYTENGYKDRRDYFENLAANFGIDVADVETVADALGPNEDFDGLVTSLIDYCDSLYGN